MNLEESDKFIKEREARNGKRRMVLISIVFCAVLIAFLFIIILFLCYQDAQTLKVFVDGTKQSFSSDLFKEIDGQEYVNAREITKMLDCTYTKGEYGKYTEDNDSCYISSNHEVVSMKADSSSMTKYILNEDTNSTSTSLSKEKLEAEQNVYGTQLTVKSANETEEVFNLKNPVKLVDGNLYIPFDLLPDIFNVNINTKEKNRVRIYTLATLYQQAKNAVKSSNHNPKCQGIGELSLLDFLEKAEGNKSDLAEKKFVLAGGGTLVCPILTSGGYGADIYYQGTKALTYLGSGYGWACERTPAEREKEKEFYGIYFNEYHTIKNDQQSELEKLPDYLEENPSFDMKA